MMADWAAYCAGKAVGGNNVVKIGGRQVSEVEDAK
jgi:hypothetical protein